MAGAFCVLAAVAVFSYLSRKGQGTVKLGSRSLEFIGPKANYNVVYITCAFVAVALLLPVVAGAVGAAIAYYSILALVVWVFIMAVYYTSKLM